MIVNQILRTTDLADLDAKSEQRNPTKTSDHGSPETSTSIGVGNSGTMQYIHWVQPFPICWTM